MLNPKVTVEENRKAVAQMREISAIDPRITFEKQCFFIGVSNHSLISRLIADNYILDKSQRWGEASSQGNETDCLKSALFQSLEPTKDQKLPPIIRLASLMAKEKANDKRAFFLVCTNNNGAQIFELIAATATERKT